MKKLWIIFTVILCLAGFAGTALFCDNVAPDGYIGTGPLMKITEGGLEYVGETPGTPRGNAMMINEAIFGAAAANIELPPSAGGGYANAPKTTSTQPSSGTTNVSPKKQKSCDHEYAEEITKEPTCSEPGEKIFACSKCGHTYKEEIPATGDHDFEEKIEKEPTCTTPGQKTKTCKTCGTIEKEAIVPTGHKFGGAVVTEPTCTEPGKSVVTCENCETAKETVIPAKGHTETDWVISRPAGMFSSGERIKKCTDCEKILEAQEIQQKYPSSMLLLGVVIVELIIIAIGFSVWKNEKRREVKNSINV